MSLLGKPVGEVAKAIGDLESGRIFQSPLNKVWRALILLNRNNSNMPKDDTQNTYKEDDSENAHTATKGSFSAAQKKDPWFQNKISAKNTRLDSEYAQDILKSKSNDYTKTNSSDFIKLVSELIKNDIVIANLDVSPAISIVIQNRPNELRIEPTSTWAAVKSMGRNNPFYFYTGGEDTISFDISWYCTDEKNRDDVVNKCRLLESWTRANGYSSSPPTLRIQWGDSGLFEDDLFILVSANYTLTHFQNASRMTHRYIHFDTGQRINVENPPQNLKLLPNYATQSLIFKRVSTSNRTWEDIIPSSKLQRTPGINYTTDTNDTLENVVND